MRSNVIFSFHASVCLFVVARETWSGVYICVGSPKHVFQHAISLNRLFRQPSISSLFRLHLHLNTLLTNRLYCRRDIAIPLSSKLSSKNQVSFIQRVIRPIISSQPKFQKKVAICHIDHLITACSMRKERKLHFYSFLLWPTEQILVSVCNYPAFSYP